MQAQRIVVNDRMQSNYIYFRTEPFGANFHPDFQPELSPKQMLELGVFGGKYMTDCSAEFPADFILVAALNPYRGSEDGTADLARAMQETYKNKVSGPILDRIDLWLEVPHVDYDTLTALKTATGETKEARKQIVAARGRMLARQNNKGVINAGLSNRDIEEHIFLNDAVKDLLKISSLKLNLSPRGYHRLIKVSRTIADLDDSEHIEIPHVLEALQYRVPL